MSRPINAISVALVTGGTGFIGRRLVSKLLENGAYVRIVSSGKPKSEGAEETDKRIQWYNHSEADLDHAVEGVTHFFNLAVVYDRPEIDNETINAVNVQLPLNIISKLRRRNKKAKCILGDTFFTKFPSIATEQGRYTCSKNKLKGLLEETGDQTDLIAFLQIEQVFGPGEKFSKVLPNITRQIINGSTRIALTSGLQSRDFIYVDDVVQAALVVAHSQWMGHLVIECGSGISTLVRHVFERIHKIANSTSTLGFGDIKSDIGITESVADIKWLKERGWTPRTSLHEGLISLVQDIKLRINNER